MENIGSGDLSLAKGMHLLEGGWYTDFNTQQVQEGTLVVNQCVLEYCPRDTVVG